MKVTRQIDIEALKDIAKQIKQARAQRGWSQNKLAEKSGVLSPYIARIETCKQDTGVTILSKLATALNTTLSINPIKSDKTMKLYVLDIAIWRSDNYFSEANTNPESVDELLFSSRQKAEEYLNTLPVGINFYNDADLYTEDIDEATILQVTGFADMDDFREALNEPYSDNTAHKNYGEDEKRKLAVYLIYHQTNPRQDIKCPNFDFEKPIEGAIVCVWSFERYVNYARVCHEVRFASYGETMALCIPCDRTGTRQASLILSREEVEAAGDKLKDELTELLFKPEWKWNNPTKVKNLIEEL